MYILPRFKEIIDKLEQTKKGIIAQSGIDYTSQDARVVALNPTRQYIFCWHVDYCFYFVS
jgi:hypothetical protein